MVQESRMKPDSDEWLAQAATTIAVELKASRVIRGDWSRVLMSRWWTYLRLCPFEVVLCALQLIVLAIVVGCIL
jgi:hypothetical protein